MTVTCNVCMSHIHITVCVCVHTYLSYIDMADMMIYTLDRMIIPSWKPQVHSYKDHQDIHMLLKSHPTDCSCLSDGEK